jgi:AraC family transcriptional regulator, transcriptional activator of pobA
MAHNKTKPAHYGLYGEKDFLLPDFMHCEKLAYRTKMHHRTIKEHVHTSLFQIFILESGTLNFTIENVLQLVNGPAIITIPENTLHGMDAGKTVKGKVITLSTSFVEMLFKDTPQALLELGRTRIITEFDNGNSFKNTLFFVDVLEKEIQNDLPEKKMVLQCYYNLLLSLTYRLLLKTTEKLVTHGNRNTRYFTLFQKSVKQSSTPMKSIKEYAAELNITSVHLNRICQAAVGKPALHIVTEFLVLEAEKFLKHTNLHIAEIAYQLNFDDPAYFSRLFKKYTGLSPKQFREKN